jgi:hypothetical protein
MRFALLLAALAIVASASQSSGQDAPIDIRSARWGMTPKQVKASEKSKPKHESTEGFRTFLLYSDTLRGLDATVGFVFVKNQLVRVKYLISEKHMNQTDYVTDYHTLMEALSEKYGAPSKDETLWKNDLYRDDFSEWGMAVAVGHLVKYAQWHAPRTEITLILKGDNFDITLAIEYSSVELHSLEENAAEKEEEDKL